VYQRQKSGRRDLSICTVIGPDSTGGFLKIGIARNVVAFEDAPSFVPANLHGHTFRHTCPDHVSHRRPPQIVEEHPGHSSSLTGRLPRSQKPEDSSSAAMKNEGRDYPIRPLKFPSRGFLIAEHIQQSGR